MNKFVYETRTCILGPKLQNSGRKGHITISLYGQNQIVTSSKYTLTIDMFSRHCKWLPSSIFTISTCPFAFAISWAILPKSAFRVHISALCKECLDNIHVPMDTSVHNRCHPLVSWKINIGILFNKCIYNVEVSPVAGNN